MSNAIRALVSAALLVWAAAAWSATVTVPGSYASIQAALDDAPTGSIIQLAPGRYRERIAIYQLTRALTLRGDVANPGAYIIDGEGLGETLLIVATGSNLIVEGVTITGGAKGYDGCGGGLSMADSQAVFRGCVFTGNSADLDGGGAFLLKSGGLFDRCVFQGNSAGRLGGGVIMNQGTTTVFEDCIFTGNEAGRTDNGFGWGGGVHMNDSSPVFRRCVIQGNQSRFAAGGLSALGVETPGVVVLEDCTIADNVTIQGDPTQPPSEGGGMHVENGTRAILRRCRIHGNTAHRGGGLNNYRAHYVITDSVIEDNDANAIGSDGGTGGGVYVQGSWNGTPGPAPTVAMANSVVRRNTATAGGGFFVGGDASGVTTNRATLDLDNVLVAENAATILGGGLLVDRTDLTVRSSFVFSNQVAGINAWGGGIAASGGSITSIDQSTIAANVAQELGGGVFVHEGGSFEVTDSRFWGNQAGPNPLGGAAIAIGWQAGPTPGPPTGFVATSVLDDDGAGAEIWEANCDLSQYSAVVYRDNVLHNPTGGIYYRNCTGGGSPTVAAFNALGPTKAENNIAGVASFTSFAAAPANVLGGTSAVLPWCAPAATGLAIDAGVGALSSNCGTIDVTPAVTTAYTLSAGGVPAANATVNVTCSGPGTAIPMSPTDKSTLRPPGRITLSWVPATGATSYDVYLDTNAQPATRVATDVQGTSVDLTDLPPNARLHWQVVAKSGCPSSTPSPIFTFETCGGSGCDFVDDFDDGDFAGWTVSGPGTARVVGGRLEVKTRRSFQLVPPATALGDGSFSLNLTMLRGRREVRLIFAFVDAGNFREVVIRGNGRVKILETTTGRPARLAKSRLPRARGAGLTIALHITGPSVEVLANGASVGSATFSSPSSGTFAIQVVSSTVSIDDVRIGAN